MVMELQVFLKECPHCKTGDLFIEESINNDIGRMYYLKCIQCGWDKDITNQVRGFDATPNQT